MDKPNKPWNVVVKTITLDINAITAERLDKVAKARHKTPESITREALAKYLVRFNRTFKSW